MRKRAWERHGVTEVVGTILILAITMVLFSSIIVAVGYFPTPNKKVYAAFRATLTPINGWLGGAEIVISHEGGQRMRSYSTQVILEIDGNYTVLPISDSNPWLTGSDEDWDPGEQWHYTILPAQVPKGAGSSIFVMILDTERNTIVWSARLSGGSVPSGPLIMEAWVDAYPETPKREPAQAGRGFTFYCRITDPDNDLDTGSPIAEMGSIGLGTYNLTDPDGDGIFTVGITQSPVYTSVGYYPVVVSARDIASHTSRRTVLVLVGGDPGRQPNLAVRGEEITVTPEHLTNRERATLKARIVNFGGPGEAIVYFYDNGVLLPSTDFVSLTWAPDEVIARAVWTPNYSGMHVIEVVVEVVSELPDFDTSDNVNSTSISVLPRILLVDDDQHIGDGSTGDTVGYMRESLSSGDFSYDMVIVGSGMSGPGYGSGTYDMREYDIVIWMTGYETSNTLTSVDQQNLKRFLNDTEGGTRPATGKLWLIGQGWLGDPNVTADFKSNYLHIAASLSVGSAPQNPLRGNITHFLGQYWPSLSVRGSYAGRAITPDTLALPFFDRSDGNADAITFEDAALQERIAVLPWEFSRIENLAEQSKMVYKVIMWLGSITHRQGKDYAVVTQSFSRNVVFFRDPVNITAVIRNNGQYGGVVEVGTYLDEYTLIDLTEVSIEGDGGEWTYETVWWANETGQHNLAVVADPNHLIEETNENNNRVAGYIQSTEILVQFRLLVIDDDESANNGGTAANETASLMSALYAFQCNNETLTVAVGANGPTLQKLMNYSAVLWITGDSTQGLTDADEATIVEYMHRSGRLWLHGVGAPWGIQNATILEEYLGISSAFNTSLSTYLRGVAYDTISHGVSYHTTDGQCTGLISFNGTEFLLSNGAYVSVRMSALHRSVVTTFPYRALGGALPGEIQGDEARAELAYMILRWLGRPEERSELRITEIDIGISEMHPQLGNAYVIHATVRNIGGYDEANALVRFLDGATQIGSDVVGVLPDANATAEMVWIPLAAGQRSIRVLVDPLGEQAEVFEWFNNNASISIYVYFFYDDMEQGTAKWTHYSTLLNINGEGTLDFLPSRADMDIISDWDWNMSTGLKNSTRQYYSYPNSFYMEEPTGYFGKADALVALVIDDSRSMQRDLGAGNDFDSDGKVTPLDAAKEAAITLVDQLSDNSLVCIWHFRGANEERALGLTPLSTGRNLVNSTIIGLTNPSGLTIIWDATGSGYTDVKNAAPLYPGLTPVVVVLSDGADYQSSDTSTYQSQKLEAGSDLWAPWHQMYIVRDDPLSGYNERIYTYHRGKYSIPWGTVPGFWAEAGGGSFDGSRIGLLYSDIKIFTIGLSLEHHDPVWLPEVAVYPGNGVTDNNAHCTGEIESGTTEYNLWRIANTSGAEYFYAPTPDDLKAIFLGIGMIIASGFNQTRSPEPARALSNNFNKIAVSPALNLSGYGAARLSLRTKYNLLSGGNGGVMGVMLNDTSTWKFKYIIPSGVYTGGLYYLENVYDDFGTQIKWCWNGVSGKGTYTWEYVDMDILPFIEPQYLNQVRIAFKYIQFGGGTGDGWYLDDVRLRVYRGEAPPDNSTKDLWNYFYTDTDAHSGNYVWRNVDPVYGIRAGIDNSLETMPIDLTNALNVTLSAYFRFNINNADGMPPDGLRVEITTDGGATWTPINLGVRASWNLSGTDTIIKDNKSYSGLPPTLNPADAPTYNYWVEAGTLTRLNIDLSPFRGNQVRLRFRLFTNNHPAYIHYKTVGPFYGFMLDDVTVTGTTVNA